MHDGPEVGTVLLTTACHRRRDGLDVPAGTHLRVTHVEQRFDNTHAMIILPFEYTLATIALDGPLQGREITVHASDTLVTAVDPSLLDRYPYPSWVKCADVISAG